MFSCAIVKHFRGQQWILFTCSPFSIDLLLRAFSKTIKLKNYKFIKTKKCNKLMDLQIIVYDKKEKHISN